MSGASQSFPKAGRLKPVAGPLALTGWVLFDWASQPFFTLVLTFLFAPYFANIFIGDPVQGQALWGYAAAIAGILVAIFSPLLGAISDAAGSRKSWIVFFSLTLIVSQAFLWFAVPGDVSFVQPIIVAVIIATISAEFTTVLTNAMMHSLVSEDRLGRLSGIGWAVGYAGGLVALIVMAGYIITDVASTKTILGFDPLFSFAGAAHQGERLVGPFSALWYLIFMVPFFLFTPDLAPPRDSRRVALIEGMVALKATLTSLRQYRNLALFLIARLVYVDGLGAIFVFGGIYAASVFGWQASELGLFGIALTLAGAIGALIGGWFDDKAGSKMVIIGSLLGLLVATLGILSIDANHVLFVLSADPKTAGSAAFSSLGEQVYLAFGVLIGLVAGPLQSSSRTMLARLAPEDKMTEFFGFYAFSGKVTSFAAPLLIGAVTAWSESQRIGISIIIAFLVLGFLMMLAVRSDRK